MTTINDIRHALQTAEKQLEKAEDRLKIFREGEEGQRLKKMKPYYAEEAYTKNRLREKEKELKRWKDKWEEQVLMLQKALIAFPAQTGNDFDFALEMQIEPILFLLLMLSNLFLLLLSFFCRNGKL